MRGIILFLLFYFGLSTIAANGFISADTTFIDDTPVITNRLQIPYKGQIRNITVLSKRDIELLPAESIAEVLANLPGLDIRQRGPFGVQADLSIDGGSFEQTALLINGIKINDPQTGHHLLNLPFSPNMIERIEVIRGPAARIYGVNSLTGAVNIVLSSESDSKLFFDTTFGSSFSKRTEEDKSGVYFGQAYQVGGNFKVRNSNHQFSYGKELSNGHRYNTSSDNDKYFYSGNVNINSDHQVSLLFGYISNEFGANGFYASPGDKDSYEIVNTAIVGLSSVHSLKEKFIIKPSISYRNNYDDYRYLGTVDEGRSQHRTEVLNFELNASYLNDWGEIGLGIESRSENISSSNIGDHNRHNIGGYLEYANNYVNNLYFNMGAYLNYNSDYGWQIFPGLDVSYRVLDNLRLVASAGTSQRLPSFTDLYIDQRPGNIGNSSLLSENAFQIETGIKYLTARVDLHAIYFYREIHGFIDWVREDDSSPFQPFNHNGNRAKGLSLGANSLVNFSNKDTKLLWSVSYNFLDHSYTPDENRTSKYIVNSLRNQGLARLGLQHNNYSFSTTSRIQQRASYKTYMLNDVRFTWTRGKLKSHIDINNLFNTSYQEAGAVLMPGRWFKIGLNYEVPIGL